MMSSKTVQQPQGTDCEAEKFFVSLDASSTTSSLKFIPKKKKKPSPFKPPPVPPSLFIPSLDQFVQTHGGLMMMQGLFSDAHEQQTAFSGVGDSSAVIHHQQQLQQHSLPHSVPHSLPHNKQHLPPLNQPALPLDLVSVSSSTHSLSDPDHQSSPSPAAGRTTTLNTAGCNGLNHLLHPHTHYDVNSIYASFNPYVTTSQLLQGSSILSSQQQQQQQVVNGHPSASSNRLGVHSSSSTSSLPPVVSHRRPPPPPENNLHTTHAASTSSSFHHPLPSMFESNHQLLQLQGRSCAPFMNNTQSNSKEKHTTLDSLGNMMPLQVLNFTPFNTQETHSTQQFKSTSGHQPKSHQLFSSQSLLHQQESFSGLPSTSGGSDVGHSHHQNKRTSSSSSSQQSYCHRPKCSYCASMIIDEECTEAEGGVYHIKCFSCTSCKTPLGGLQYIMHPNTTTTCDSQDNLSTVTRSPYCTSCFDSLFGEYCEGCGELIHVAKGSAISHEGRSWHALDKCFKCYFCKKSLLGLPFLPHSSGFIFCSVTCSKDAFALHNKSRSNATSGNNNSRSTTSSSHIHEQKQQLESFPEESDQSHQQETSFSESPADSAHGSLSSSSSSQLNQRQQTLPGESCDQNQQQEASSPGPTLDPLQELLSSSSLHQQQQQLQTSSSSEESDQSPQQETLLSESPTDPLYASLLPSTSPPLLQDKHLKEDFSCNQREEEEETSFSATDHPLHGSLSTSKEDHDRDQDHHHHQRQVDQQQLEQNNSHDKRDTTNNTTSTATSKYSSVDGDDDARKNNKTASKEILQSKGCSSDADAGDDLGNDARKENSIREASCDTIPSNESSLKPAVKSVSFDPETMKEKEGPSFVRRLRKSHSSSAHSSCSSPSKGSHSKRSSSRHHRRQGKKVCSCSTSSSSSHHHHHRSHDRSHHHHHHRRRSSTDRDHSQRRKRRDRQEYNDSQEEEERDCYESDASCSSCSSFSSSSSSCSTCSSSSSSYSSDSDDASNNDSRQIPSSQGLKEIKTTATGINSQTIVQSRELLFRSSSEVQKKNQIPKIKTIDLSSSSSLSSCVIS